MTDTSPEDIAEDDEPLPPWQAPGRWFRDETYWRQVTSSVIAASISAGVAFLSVRAEGLFAAIPWVVVGLTVAFVGLFIACLLASRSRTGCGDSGVHHGTPRVEVEGAAK